MAGRPALSVVVATRNRAGRLAALLASLRAQQAEPDSFEVIVVDDGSTDATPRLLERERGQGDLALRVVRHGDAAGPAAARNAGWRAAQADLVGFTDDDCVVDPDWAAQAIALADKEPGAAFQGRTDPIEAELPQGPYDYTQRIAAAGPWYETCNIFYPREVLEDLGGFDAEAFPRWGGEDTDLGWRARERGVRILYAPECRAHHAVVRLGALGRLERAWRYSELVALLVRHPGLAAHLEHGRFWTYLHWHLFRALVAAAVARRPLGLPVACWLAGPYVTDARRSGLRNVPFTVLRDGVEMAAIARGGLRHRTFVL